ncbi:MAG: RHS repeat domain-containing protein [Chloroflexota bacterium]
MTIQSDPLTCKSLLDGKCVDLACRPGQILRVRDGAIQPSGTCTATLAAIGQADQSVNITLIRQASATYSYDTLSHLIQATNSWAETSYTYEPVGNRLTSVIAGASSSYTSDKVDRLTAVGGTTYTNDANGNRTGRGADTFTYDLANRLTQAAISGGSTTNHAYDGDGKRMCSSTPCTTPEYVYDVNRGLPVLIQDTSKQYVWGLGLTYTVSGSAIAVHHNDGLGSTRAVTTAAGQVESTYLTDDFGGSKLVRGINPARMQYTGEPRDGETGFVYLRARMYDPLVGRFLQRDPYRGLLRSPITLNGFTYVGQNPTNLRDPSGYIAVSGEMVKGGVLTEHGMMYRPPDPAQCARDADEGHWGKLLEIGCMVIHAIVQPPVMVGPGGGVTVGPPTIVGIKPPRDDNGGERSRLKNRDQRRAEQSFIDRATRLLTKEQRRRLHDEITQQDLAEVDIVHMIKSLFGEEKVPIDLRHLLD